VADQQLHIAIGEPPVTNAAMLTIFFAIQTGALNRRLDDMRELWRADLRCVQEVVDARLRLIGNKPGIQ